jgi:DNA ligase-1
MIKEPMLSAKLPTMQELLDAMPYPMLASRKIDGIRAICSNHEGIVRLYSRKLKLIPNRSTQVDLAQSVLVGLDGELVVGNSWGEGVFARTTSGVMSMNGDPSAVWHVFDDWTHTDHPFSQRYERVCRIVDNLFQMRVVTVSQTNVRNAAEAEAYHAESLKLGYEGSMFRRGDAPYKEGRATVRSGWLFKCKEWDDAEAVVVDVEELMHNANEAQTNELGRTKRSSHQANMVPMGTLGAFVCRTEDGRVFNVGGGPGLTSAMRQHFWNVRDSLIGRTAKYRFLRVGVVELPRHPLFLGFRED